MISKGDSDSKMTSFAHLHSSLLEVSLCTPLTNMDPKLEPIEHLLSNGTPVAPLLSMTALDKTQFTQTDEVLLSNDMFEVIGSLLHGLFTAKTSRALQLLSLSPSREGASQESSPCFQPLPLTTPRMGGQCGRHN